MKVVELFPVKLYPFALDVLLSVAVIILPIDLLSLHMSVLALSF